MPNEDYFKWPLPYFKNFIERTSVKRIAFIPYAAVSVSFNHYESLFKGATENLDCEITSIHHSLSHLDSVDAIAVAGGNSFALLHRLYENGLTKKISDMVAQGTPYIGWSAGSNIACPSIMTTNDMPIVQPKSFESLGIVPFQINPHYTEKNIPNHNGETRDARINEFIAINEDMHVAAIPEGSLIEIENGKPFYKGVGELKHFKNGQEPAVYCEQDDISFLLG